MTITAKLLEFQSRFEAFQTFLVGAVKGNRDILYEKSVRTFPAANYVTHENVVLDNTGRNLFDHLGEVYIEILDEIPSGISTANLGLSYSLMVYKNGLLLDPNLDYGYFIKLGTIYMFMNPTFVETSDTFTYVIRKVLAKTTDMNYVVSDTELTVAKSSIENYQDKNDLMVYDVSNSKPLTSYSVMELNDDVVIYDLPKNRNISLFNASHYYYKRFYQNIPRETTTGYVLLSITDDPIPVLNPHELEVYQDGRFLVPNVDFKLVEGKIQIKTTRSISPPPILLRTRQGLRGNSTLIQNEISPVNHLANDSFSSPSEGSLFQIFHFRPIDLGYELDENDYLQSDSYGSNRTFSGEFAYLNYLYDTKDQSNQYFPLEGEGKLFLDSVMPYSPENLNVFSNGVRIPQDRITASTNKINAFLISEFTSQEKVYISVVLARSKNTVMINQLNMFTGLIEVDTYDEDTNFDNLCLVIMHRYLEEMLTKMVDPKLPYYPYIDQSVDDTTDTVS